MVVVDDEPEMLGLISDVLESEGHETVGFETPVAVIDAEEELDGEPDLFLLDLMLPQMDGIALAARLARDGFADTPKVAISASNDKLRAARASQLFAATISKPFDIVELLNCVDKYLS
ncbi:MAG TPA: response regulator [Chloroflexota bacterium]|nr:response regulator [Chloroflexota bacterium]